MTAWLAVPLHPVFTLAVLGLLLSNLVGTGHSGPMLVAGWTTFAVVLAIWVLHRRRRR
jgi:high-affinity Fe2+/Pb2+ permease